MLHSDAKLAAEYHAIQTELKELEARKEEIAAHFKAATGDRVYGEYLVSVKSGSREVMDQEAVRAKLGADTPMKLLASVVLKVSRLTLVN